MRAQQTHDSQTLTKYLQGATALVSKRFNKTKAQALTKSTLQAQIAHPLTQSAEISSTISKDDKWSTRSALWVQNQILSRRQSGTAYADYVIAYHLEKVRQRDDARNMTWSFLDQPLAHARHIDATIKHMDTESALAKYPLLGYVMSVKDSIYVKDSPSTCGLFINLDRVPSQDPEMIAQLKAAGAVITTKGNIPQYLFSMESNNNIFGDSLNPFDETRTSGGSSGGEAALVQRGIVNASIGSDGAGSLRIPAMFCGVCAFKPTPMRFSVKAHAFMFERMYGSDVRPKQVDTPFNGQCIAIPALGPIARTAADLEPLMQVISRDQSFDFRIPPMPWKISTAFRKRVAVVRQIDIVLPSKTASRALQETIDNLQSKGYEIVELDLGQFFTEATLLAITVFNKNRYLWENIKGTIDTKEPLCPLYSMAKRFHKTPDFLLKIIYRFMAQSTKRKFLKCYFDALNTNQFHLSGQTSKMHRALQAKMDQAGVSALLTIANPLPALKLYDSNLAMIMCCYYFVFNLFNMPAGVVPVARVRADEEVYETEETGEIIECMRRNMEGSEGMPVGVQVVTRSYQDEIALEIMKDIQR